VEEEAVEEEGVRMVLEPDCFEVEEPDPDAEPLRSEEPV
jgi:hypothetical protein